MVDFSLYPQAYGSIVFPKSILQFMLSAVLNGIDNLTAYRRWITYFSCLVLFLPLHGSGVCVYCLGSYISFGAATAIVEQLPKLKQTAEPSKTAISLITGVLTQTIVHEISHENEPSETCLYCQGSHWTPAAVYLACQYMAKHFKVDSRFCPLVSTVTGLAANPCLHHIHSLWGTGDCHARHRLENEAHETSTHEE